MCRFSGQRIWRAANEIKGSGERQCDLGRNMKLVESGQVKGVRLKALAKICTLIKGQLANLLEAF